MMDGERFRLVRQTAYGKERLFESRRLPDIAEFIRQKDAPHRELSTDGGEPWQERMPESIRGDR